MPLNPTNQPTGRQWKEWSMHDWSGIWKNITSYPDTKADFDEIKAPMTNL